MRELAELGVLVTPRESGGGLAGAGHRRAPPAHHRPADADLGLNASGAVLAVELLEAQRALERRIRDLEALAATH